MNTEAPVLLRDFRRSKVVHRFEPGSGRIESIADGDANDVAGHFDRRLVGLLRPRHINIAIIFRDDCIDLWIGERNLRFSGDDNDVCFVRSGVAPFVHEFVARRGDEIVFDSKYWWSDLVEDGFKTKDIFTYLADELVASSDSVRRALTNWKMHKLSKMQRESVADRSTNFVAGAGDGNVPAGEGR